LSVIDILCRFRAPLQLSLLLHFMQALYQRQHDNVLQLCQMLKFRRQRSAQKVIFASTTDSHQMSFAGRLRQALRLASQRSHPLSVVRTRLTADMEYLHRAQVLHWYH
jgi:hypothetical protein